MRYAVKGVVAGVVAALALSMFSADAHAFSRGRWASHSSGSWGGSSGSWGSHASWGSHGGWGRARWAGWSHSGGWSHSSGGWSHSSGSWSHSSGGWAPAGVPAGTYQPATPPPPPAAEGVEATSTSFTVRVPAEAKVYVNDTATTSTGAVRNYYSRGLTPGRSYTFRVRAELERDGETLTETRTITLTAGSRAGSELAFNFQAGDSQLADQPVETKLTLRVPSDARVILAGKETRSTGEVREFSTSTLAAGEVWEKYTIVVQLSHEGQVLTQERTINLAAGDQRELTIAFDQVAGAGPDLVGAR